MARACDACGLRTYMGHPLCVYCRLGRQRPATACEDCGRRGDARPDRNADRRVRCPSCRDAWQVGRILEAAPPVLAAGGSLAGVGKVLGLSRERVRQIIALHPELRHLLRRAALDRLAGSLRVLLEAGETRTAAARTLGVPSRKVGQALRDHPELRALDEANRAARRARCFDAVFELVQAEGLSIRAACGRLGIRCRSAIYDVARGAGAQARFPALAEVRFRRPFAPLRVRGGAPDLGRTG